MVKSRRLKQIIEEESTIPESHCYCRRCQKVKRSSFFHKAVDLTLDVNGFFSVCKECIDELYKKVLEAEYGSIQKAVLHLCRKLNVKYDEAAIDSAIKQIESSNWNVDKFFGVYRAKLLAVGKSTSDAPLGLEYMDNPIVNLPETNLSGEEQIDLRELIIFWGTEVKVEIEF